MIKVILINFKELPLFNVYPLTVMVLSLSCYEPEEYVPPIYLEPEVSLVVDNIAWEGISEANVAVDFQTNSLSMGLIDTNNTAWFTCLVTGKDSKLFTDYSNSSEILPIEPGIYKSNDSIIVTMFYRTSIDGAEITNPRETIYWYSSDENFNIWNIERAFMEEGEKYISGSFSARTYHALSNQFPRYRYVEGTFKNVRVTKTYNKSQ